MSNNQGARAQLQEKGIAWFLLRPHKAVSLVSSWIAGRLKEERTTLYYLEMPLAVKKLAVEEVELKVISSLEELKDFPERRAAEDKNYSAASYRSELQSRFDDGAKCFAAIVDGSIASVIFGNTKGYYSGTVNYYFSMPEKTAALFDVYTFEAYRNRFLNNIVFVYCTNYFAEMGCLKARGWIMAHNKTSIMVHHLLGLNSIIGSVTLIQKYGMRSHDVKHFTMKTTDLLKKK